MSCASPPASEETASRGVPSLRKDIIQQNADTVRHGSLLLLLSRHVPTGAA